jgi:phage-related holin
VVVVLLVVVVTIMIVVLTHFSYLVLDCIGIMSKRILFYIIYESLSSLKPIMGLPSLSNLFLANILEATTSSLGNFGS